MHSIQLISAVKPLCFGNVKKTAKESGLKNSDKKIIDSKSKSLYITAGFCGLAAAGAAITLIQSKNKKAAKILFKPFQEELYNFSAYLKKAKEANINSAKDYMDNCVEKNIIGTGQNSVVYKFTNPIMDNWVIKVNTKHNDFAGSFSHNPVQIPDEFEGFNMGQSIAALGERVRILKKIDAKPHSIKDWSSHRRSGVPIKQEEAQNFLEDVKNIARFPQAAFDEYAQKLKMLDDKGYKADSFNPNNYMIDYKKQKLYIIDFYKYDVDAHLNTKYDLFCPLVDYSNFERFYTVMNDAQKKEYINSAELLAKKCTNAAKNAGINLSEDTFRDFIGRIDSREGNNSMYTRAFNSMKNICSDINF